MLNYRPASEVWTRSKKTLLNPPTGPTLRWWPRFNSLMGGLRPNELTLLCAPTGAGKTQLLANISAQLAEDDVAQFIAPVETGDEDYVNRMISSLLKQDINTGESVDEGRLHMISEKFKFLLDRKILISTYDNRVEPEDMITTLKYMHQEYGVRVAVLDNLNFFLKVVSSQLEKAEMDSAIHEFVILAKKLPMHVILIVHPRKTQDGRVESEFDIKGSSTAVQEAHNVILFNRPKPEDVASGRVGRTDRELTFRKVRRRGTAVGESVWFDFRGGSYREFIR